MNQSADIHDVDSLTAAIRGGCRPTYLFFWGHTAKDDRIGKHVLSQWWPADVLDRRSVVCRPPSTT